MARFMSKVTEQRSETFAKALPALGTHRWILQYINCYHAVFVPCRHRFLSPSSA
jgi:hypothetical protein